MRFAMMFGALVFGACEGEGTIIDDDVVDVDEDGFSDEDDCDDERADVFPGADELCDQVDNNCDGNIDEATEAASQWFVDSDGDGFGDAFEAINSCLQPVGHVDNGNDCDDASQQTFPGADELCDELDNDCDTEIDEDPIDAPTWFRDVDGDGYGNAELPPSCKAPTAEAVLEGGDCDEGSASVHPGAREVCDDDFVDINCNPKDEVDACGFDWHDVDTGLYAFVTHRVARRPEYGEVCRAFGGEFVILETYDELATVMDSVDARFAVDLEYTDSDGWVWGRTGEPIEYECSDPTVSGNEYGLALMQDGEAVLGVTTATGYQYFVCEF